MNAVGHEPPEKPLVEPLTRREQEILELLAEGETLQSLGAHGLISWGVVRNPAPGQPGRAGE